MFDNKSSVEKLEDRVKDLLDQDRVNRIVHKLEIDRIRHEHELQVARMSNEFDLVAKQHQFALDHFADDRVKELETQKTALNQHVSVLEKEKEMLERVVSIEGDIVDVKDLVKNLIAKLPEVNLKNLTINTNGNKQYE